MFEKEAEKWVENNLHSTEEDYIKAFKDGAEFGYNKVKEWHYPSKGDLPEKTGRYLILNRFGEHYFTTNITEYLEGAKMFSRFSMKDVYAWKEIVLPELKESE
jgi:hypothetical protein